MREKCLHISLNDDNSKKNGKKENKANELTELEAFLSYKKKLEEYDINQMTPIEALQALNTLVHMFKDD